MPGKYKHIIWDWNGTLLDDVDIAIEAMNSLLKKQELQLLDNKSYREVFGFPIRDYYIQIGFDFDAEPFEKLAVEFMVEFNSDKYVFKLYNGVEKVLHSIAEMGISQSILSASKENELNEMVAKLGISRFFSRITGLNDYFAASKVDKGFELLKELDLHPAEVLLVGDTVHDYEVSRELGCSCLLVCNGHQCRERLSVCGTDMIDDVLLVKDYLMTIHRQAD